MNSHSGSTTDKSESPLILVVDDDPDFRQAIELVLSAAGYRVRALSTPEGALEIMAEEKPRIVITDLMMTRLDSGFSFARQIKNDPRFADVRIIIITGIASQRGFDITPRTTEELKQMGADEFLAKPIMPEILLAKIAGLLRS